MSLHLRRVGENEQSRKMLALIESFHALDFHDDIKIAAFDSKGYFDCLAFASHSRKLLYTDAELDCARFILFVWNSSFKPSFGRFKFGEAIVRWDAQHRAAFVAWAQKPWWP